MIGQKGILNWIDNLDNSKVPHFIIFVGSKGSGKTTLAKYIANKLEATFAISDIKVDSVREVIDTAYKARTNVVYCIQDADTMRSEAKNAMLKITEEPPNNAWFVLTVQDDSTLLDTIKSRGTLFEIEPYTESELKEYLYSHYSKVDNESTILKIATTPYEVDKLVEYGNDFVNYVELVVDNIGEVASANAFKSSTKLAIKSDDGYDLRLFWNTFIQVCLQRIEKDPLHYAEGICKTVMYPAKLQKLGANKQQLYDGWVFDIREVWY